MTIPLSDEEPTRASRRGRRIVAVAVAFLTVWIGGFALIYARGSGAGGGMGGMNMGGDTSTTRGDRPGQADETFAKAMFLHHRQELVFARLAATRATSADLRALAATVGDEDEAQMTTIDEWLQRWGTTANAGASEHLSGTGMLDGPAIDAVMSASGAEFDRLVLDALIGLHRGALAMAEVESAGGRVPEATAMARTVTVQQGREVAAMEKLRGG